LKRIVLLATVSALIAAMLATATLSVSAQDYSGQYDSGQYDSATGETAICAPWSKAWDISQGSWYFQWYRWCYDPSTSDPAYESSWYQEASTWEWGDPVNLCPGSGSCTMTTGSGGSFHMSSLTTF
jgi:hypothetical protein